jgi:23S rRNA pseudoU1915 N3-methylase RlmH
MIKTNKEWSKHHEIGEMYANISEYIIFVEKRKEKIYVLVQHKDEYVKNGIETYGIRFMIPEGHEFLDLFTKVKPKSRKEEYLNEWYYNNTNATQEDADLSYYENDSDIKSVNDFIKELQLISENKRKLPILITCPNGMQVYPNIKIQIKEGTFLTPQQEVEAIVITW